MHWSAQALARQSSQLFGRRVQLWLFGLPGTVVHEGSHVLACLLFGHRVDRVRWFDPRATDGALGSVEHSYDPSSAYQRVGTIVIGLSPLLVGAGVLLLAARWLLDVPIVALAELKLADLAFADIQKVTPWRGALFAYTAVSVGGSMHLSASDLRGTRHGVITLGIWLAITSLIVLSLWWVLSQTAPAVWPQQVMPVLRRVAATMERASDAAARALQLAVVVNVVAAAVLFVARRLLRAVW